MSSKNPIINDSDYNGVKIHHEGFNYEDERQKMVQKAYELGGFDLVMLIECENGNWNPFAIGDDGHAFGLCQMNDRYHKIPQEYFDDWGKQIEICAEKRKGGTKFYGPDRYIKKGIKCSEYILDRFTFTE